ncbi:MAG: hypothetical protein Q9213_005071 [Squamulea squamosa]
MNSLRLLRVVARAQSISALRQPLHRRGYADAVSDKIKLTLALPHQSIYKSTDVYVPISVSQFFALRHERPVKEELINLELQSTSQYPS